MKYYYTHKVLIKYCSTPLIINGKVLDKPTPYMGFCYISKYKQQRVQDIHEMLKGTMKYTVEIDSTGTFTECMHPIKLKQLKSLSEFVIVICKGMECTYGFLKNVLPQEKLRHLIIKQKILIKKEELKYNQNLLNYE